MPLCQGLWEALDSYAQGAATSSEGYLVGGSQIDGG